MSFSSYISQTNSVSTYLFSGDDIIAALRKAKELPDVSADERVEVTFQIPGGGDWSNATIDVDMAHPITVKLICRYTSSL